MTRAAATLRLSVLLTVTALVIAPIGIAISRGADHANVSDLRALPVTLQNGRTLFVQTHEVTVAQWQRCFDAGQCALDLSRLAKPAAYPATGISYPDAVQFLDWMNSTGGRVWRLPTAAEWSEIAAEVMPDTPDPIFTDPSLTWASSYLLGASATGRALRPSGAFSVTTAGIADLDGTVWEWTQDCYAGSNGQGASVDPARCPAYIMGGEHEAVMSYLVRDPARGGCAVGAPPAHLGVRLVSEG